MMLLPTISNLNKHDDNLYTKVEKFISLFQNRHYPFQRGRTAHEFDNFQDNKHSYFCYSRNPEGAHRAQKIVL